MIFNSQTYKTIQEKWRHAGFQKYARNTAWAFSARLIGFFTSFLTVAVVARYLGPGDLGKLEYSQSFVAILSIFASLGIDQILYRDLVNHPEKESELLGTAIFSKLIFGIPAFLLSIGISMFLGNETILTILIGICASVFVFSPIGTVAIFFSAQVKVKYSSQISIFFALFIPILKVLVIFFNKGIIYFAFIIFLEAFLSSVWMLYVYVVYFKKSPLHWKFSFDIFKRLVKDSWPLFLAGLSGYLYAKMDQVLILHYIDSATVGIYSAATKLTQMWAFLPGLIISSMFPAIVNARKVNFLMYAKRFRLLTGVTVGVAILIALPLFIFAPLVIKLVFGNGFIESVPILRIYLWTSVAITLVVLVQHYLIAENLSRIFLYTSIIGATANVLLNIILIPRFGGAGSAWGTMISYFIVVLSLFIFKKSRDGIVKIFYMH